jgi:hypothetical protein
MTELIPLILLFVFFLPVYAADCQGQTSVISKKLAAIGFENVRAFRINHDLFISLENNIFRWNVTGICIALDTIAKYAGGEDRLLLYILEKDIPRIMIKTSAKEWTKYTGSSMPESTIISDLEVGYVEYGLTNGLKTIAPLNPAVNKIDIVLYPQFILQNTLLSQIYEIQLNLAPAIEVSLWKGMQFTGQVIFPLKNDLGSEGDHIRPGFVTLAQEFNIPHRWFGRLAFGNFNADRYGTDFSLNHPFKNNRWEVGMNVGLTGSSFFYDEKWITSEINHLSWFVRSRYFYPKYNLQFDLSYGRYINSDYGFRADCTRHFKAATIGFYAMYTGDELNGGFHFSIPLPPRKRNRKHVLRLVPPRFFDWEYNAGTEFYYGRYYETRPNENRSEHWNNPISIRSEILKSGKK